MRKQFYIFSGLLGIALYVFLQSYFAYYFFYVEQSQLFLLSKTYWIEKASTMGGVCEWCAEACVQFFAYPYMGALLTTLVVLLAACLTGAWLRRMSGSGYMAFLGWLPALALCWASLDFNYNYQGIMAYLLFLFFAIILSPYENIIKKSFAIPYPNKPQPGKVNTQVSTRSFTTVQLTLLILRAAPTPILAVVLV